jgi:hypothetical protein
MINSNNNSNIYMACECLIIPVMDCLHYIFFCYGKKFRCGICNTRFKHRCQRAEHIRNKHREIFNFKDSHYLESPKPVNSMNRDMVIERHF